MNKTIYAFRFQPEKCIQCHACTVACKIWNNTEHGVNLRHFYARFAGKFPTPQLVPVSVSCLHCNDPACAAICPTGAIAQGEDGVVRVDRSLCVGCRACLDACPVDAPQFDSDGLMRKCELCGGEAACASACPTQALTLEQLQPEEKAKLDQTFLNWKKVF